VTETLPFTYTGADFYALCSDAMLKAVTRQAARVDAKIKAMNDEAHLAGVGPRHHHQKVSTAFFFDHYATPDDIRVMVTEHDFLDAHRELIPSVSAGELAHYERVRAAFEGGRDRGGGLQSPTTTTQLASHDGFGNGKRVASGPSAKGKGKAPGGGKGKGKAVAYFSDDEDGRSEGGGAGTNGRGLHKGKGKAVAAPFHEGAASDDDGLYE
jgi:peroxin-6